MPIDYDADIHEAVMNELDSSSPALISITPPFDAGIPPRLLVLISPDSEYTPATRRITGLAHARGAQVLFLGLCRDASHEFSLRRELVALCALLQDAKVYAELKVEVGTRWMEVVRANYRDGDMIVCFAEQRSGRFHKSLSQILESNLDAPVYLLSDVSSDSRSKSDLLSEVLAWAGSIGVIVAVFLLQIQIVSMPKDWAQTTLLILSVLAEAWLIGVWNSLFG